MSSSSDSTPAKAGFGKLKVTAVMIGVLALAALAAPARATLISVDYLLAGDGGLTRDSSTGLDWLDVTFSLNVAPADVATLVANGGQFQGFRLATVAEFNALVANVGGPDVLSTDLSQIEATRDLIKMLGVTNISYHGYAQPTTLGWLDGLYDPARNQQNLGVLWYREFAPPGPGLIASNTYLSGAIYDANGPAAGLFLVRGIPPSGSPAVPDTASSVGLLLLSLTALGALRRWVPMLIA